MKIKRIEHVGVVVRDLEKSRKLWEECFGISLGGVEHTPGRPHKLALYPIGESMVELLAGISPDSKFARMCDEGKAGINHICFEVENIDEALAGSRRKGCRSSTRRRASVMPVRIATRPGGHRRLPHRAAELPAEALRRRECDAALRPELRKTIGRRGELNAAADDPMGSRDASDGQ